MEVFKQQDISAAAYNDYIGVRKLPSDIMDYLFNNCDELWKLLYYKGDTVGKENVPVSEKRKMIAKSSGDNLDEYQVLFQFFTSDSSSKANSQLRIQIISAESTNRTNVLCRVGIQCIVNNKNMIVSTDESPIDNRALAMAQAVIQCLNGQSMETAKTPLNIDKSIDRYSGITKYDFNNNFSGYIITMSCYV
ncbi:hypothetical protein [Holdemanella porci]|uniref:hypothetical protein n=1 Tax=Holdemanella porci TaxID=2652276 RepID=UPI003AB84239